MSGKLAAETNTVNGVVLKFQPPAEAKVATKRWRLYVFKNGQLTDQVGCHPMRLLQALYRTCALCMP